VKINIIISLGTNKVFFPHIIFVVRIMLEEGIEVYYPNDSNKDSTVILFGDHKLDVIRILGNPNKEYLNGDSLFLNYLELGLDI
jgi:hypothetical protein